jgi:tripartite motif-containing protein 71
VFDPSGRFLRVFGSQGTTDGKFSYPWGVTTDALGFIYVCDKVIDIIDFLLLKK